MCGEFIVAFQYLKGPVRKLEKDFSFRNWSDRTRGKPRDMG